MTRLLQITDPHIGPPGYIGYGIDPRARLAACVADINAHYFDATLCVVTGDLVNAGTDEEYEVLSGVLADLRVPCRVIPGNHDRREGLRRHCGAAVIEEAGFLQGSIELPSGRALLLDTLSPGMASGELCDQRLEWLAAALAEDDRQVCMFMHHPPLDLGIDYMDRIGLVDADRFWSTVAPFRERIDLIAFGHVHRPVCGVWKGIPFAGCPSTAHQIALELGPTTPPRLHFNHEPPCYAIIEHGRDGAIVHQQRYSENWNVIPRRGEPSRTARQPDCD